MRKADGDDSTIMLDCLAEDIAVDRDGLVHAPTGPCLGANIDFDLIEPKKIGMLS